MTGKHWAAWLASLILVAAASAYCAPDPDIDDDGYYCDPCPECASPTESPE